MSWSAWRCKFLRLWHIDIQINRFESLRIFNFNVFCFVTRSLHTLCSAIWTIPALHWLELKPPVRDSVGSVINYTIDYKWKQLNNHQKPHQLFKQYQSTNLKPHTWEGKMQKVKTGNSTDRRQCSHILGKVESMLYKYKE